MKELALQLKGFIYTTPTGSAGTQPASQRPTPPKRPAQPTQSVQSVQSAKQTASQHSQPQSSPAQPVRSSWFLCFLYGHRQPASHKQPHTTRRLLRKNILRHKTLKSVIGLETWAHGLRSMRKNISNIHINQQHKACKCNECHVSFSFGIREK